MRIHFEIFTADDPDVLGGTALDQLEAGGQLDIFATQVAADARLSIRGPSNEPLAERVFIPQPNGATAQRPSVNDDVTFSLLVATGGHYTVDLDITAANTVQIMAVYRKAGVDF